MTLKDLSEFYIETELQDLLKYDHLMKTILLKVIQIPYLHIEEHIVTHDIDRYTIQAPQYSDLCC